ncbi:GGDEF domain-containing protein [Enterobacterales bacterium CwR94]|nr:GGDEF domain-containing protein [Enterobacterales bacterium CwR94]
MKHHELFSMETALLELTREIASQPQQPAEHYQEALLTLCQHYERLIRESGRLITRSDRAERELTRLNSELQSLAHALEYKATHDPLTEVFNRSAIIDRITQALSRGRAGLILLDIDHFKAINDTWGHPVGDKVIIELITRVRQSVPESGSIGRVGGEEFTVLLPGSSLAQTVIIAGYIHASLNAKPLSVLPERLVTASLGISFGEQASDFEQLYGTADEALYEAKRRGRNRLHWHEVKSLLTVNAQ